MASVSVGLTLRSPRALGETVLWHIAATSTSPRPKQLVAILKSQQAPPELARIDIEGWDDASTGRRAAMLSIPERCRRDRDRRHESHGESGAATVTKNYNLDHLIQGDGRDSFKLSVNSRCIQSTHLS